MDRIFRRTLLRLSAPLLLTVVTGICILLLAFGYAAQAQDGVVINEVCSSNFSAVRDDRGEYPDYVELYNPSLVEVSLEGLFLSDDPADPTGYPLTGSVPAGGYRMIWLGASGEEGAAFGLSRKGDALYLSDGSGRFLDSQSIPALPFNMAWGRVKDGGEEWALMTPTAGISNQDAKKKGLPQRTLEEPVFSAESGFYGEPFELTLAAKENEIIYYTLDGSEPTTDSIRYEGPISIEDACRRENLYAARTDLSPTNGYTPPDQVDKATVVRAVSCSLTEHAVSNIATKVYFVGFETKPEYDGYPILSLVSGPSNLFDEETGIYGNGAALEAYKEAGGLQNGELLSAFSDENGEMHYLYTATNAVRTGREWEREASVSWFDEDHTYCFEQDVGMRIAGQSTRAASQKSFTLFSREIYDENAEFPYQFFPGQTYSTIKVRNGGSDNAGSKIMDAFLAELSADQHVSVQDSRPCVVFLNGEYWGLYNLRERFKPEYLRNHYGVNESNVWIIEAGRPDTGGDAAEDFWEQTLEFISGNDMSVEENYDAACDLVDMQSLIDFYCINLYVDNTDVAFNRNFAAWRTILPDDTAYGDGRWRFMLYDMDGSLNQYDNNTFAETEEGIGLMDEALIRSLMNHEGFRKQFCLTFLDIANTVFSYEKVHHSLMEWKDIYRTQVTESHRRFFGDEAEGVFEERIEAFDTFFRERFPWAVSFLAESFGLRGETETVTVRIREAEGGTVLFNTVCLNEAEWSGTYLTDYPVTVCAQPREGYRFAGWRGSQEGQEERMEIRIPEGGLVLEAVFEAEEGPAGTEDDRYGQ